MDSNEAQIGETFASILLVSNGVIHSPEELNSLTISAQVSFNSRFCLLSGISFMKRTFQPSVIRRKRTHGFLVRMRTRGGRAIKRPGFSVLLKANVLGVPRLGLIVPKRVFPRAVDRNRVKRLLREWFRGHQTRLGSCDILIRLSARTVALAEIERCLAGTS